MLAKINPLTLSCIPAYFTIVLLCLMPDDLLIKERALNGLGCTKSSKDEIYPA
jgi:hypothetical protein